MASEKEYDPENEDEFIEKAKERFKEASEYWDKIYRPAKENLEFFASDQWDQNVIQSRQHPGEAERPTLTINRLPQFHNLIVNDYRQASIGMRAVGTGQEDVETARVVEGLFRQIEKHSNAQVAYIKALSDASIAGLGYIRVLTDYISEGSFDQDIIIGRVTTPFKHYPDPHAVGFFLEDADYWFVVDKIKKDQYEEEYGEEDTLTPFDADVGAEWADEHECVIAEYFYCVYKKDTLLLLGDGSTAWLSEQPEGIPLNIMKQRETKRKKLHWAKIDGTRVLETREWPTNRIPIIPVWGNELWVDEKRKLTGFVENAKDSQRMHNYMESTKTEMIALSPKAPYIAAAGQLEGYEDDWRNASVTPKSVLTYKPISVEGQLVGAPQRQTYEAPVQAIVQASQQAIDAMKATIGIYDASLGERSNEVSGVAIGKRQAQGAKSTYNYVDNLAMSVGYMGKVIAELIPIIYDTERQLRIIGEDGVVNHVIVNAQDEAGAPVGPQLFDAHYDLILDAGPGYASQREETAKSIVELSHNYPKLMEVAGDIAIGALNFSGAQEIARRLKRTIPPEVIGPDEDPVTKLHAAEAKLAEGAEILKGMHDRLEELELENAKLELAQKDKSEENQLKRDKLDLDRKELLIKLREVQQKAQDGKAEDAAPLMDAVIEGMIKLGAQVETMQDMLLASLAEGETAPEPDVGSPGAAVAPVDATEPVPPAAGPGPSSPAPNDQI